MRTKRLLLVLLSTLFIFSSGCKKSEKPLPVADFSYTGANVQAPATVTFSNLSLNATSSLWDFGDNGSSLEMNPSHIYQTGGVFTVKLTAFNSDGSNSITKTVNISNAPSQCKIISLSLINIPFVDGTGASWDAGSGPDVFFKITDGSNVLFDATENRFTDITPSGLPLLWSFSTPFIISPLTSIRYIDIWDYDPYDPDDYIGGVTFNPSSFNNYPANVNLTNQGVTVKLNLQWQ